MLKPHTWHSYSKIYAIGHRATQPLFDECVTIEEKVDGSQFSFCKTAEGKLLVRSKRVEFDIEAAPDMFQAACDTVKRIAHKLCPGWTYRGEVLSKPKHNVLCYGRVPSGNIILFDVETDLCGFLPYSCKENEAARIGLEVVPKLFEGVVDSQEILDEIKGISSCLGGTKIEGYVVKNYQRFNPDGKVLMGKWVSEAFKEVHRRDWKPDRPQKQDLMTELARSYTTAARWQKAVQHLAEAGRLDQSPKDIGDLIKEVQSDIRTECSEEIKEILFNAYWKELSRCVVRGLPEWYKMQLEKSVFQNGDLFTDESE